MKTRLWLLAVVMVMSAALSSGLAVAAERGVSVRAAPGRGAPAGDCYLLAIGIDRYVKLPTLRTAVSDAKAVVQVLQERYGFTPERTVEIYDAEATATRIQADLRKLAERLTEEDSLLVYYAGHGDKDRFTGVGSWLPVDADTKDMTTWIDNSRIKAIARGTKARHVLLISDSCFSGDFFSESRAAPPEITDAYVRAAFSKTSREAITSGGLQPVSDAGFGEHSVFAHFLLKSLSENHEPYRLPAAIHERVKGGVAANARQQTQHGLLTGTGGEIGGSFVLFLADSGGAARLDKLIEQKKKQASLIEEREAESRAAADAQAAEVAEREKKLAALEAKITAMKRRLADATTAAGGPSAVPAATGDTSTLDEMLALVEQKERQRKELEGMRRRAEEERKAREAELRRIANEENRKKDLAIKADLRKYGQIASSELGKEMKKEAWNSILTKWGLEPGSVRDGDTKRLRAATGIVDTTPAPPRGRHSAGQAARGFGPMPGIELAIGLCTFTGDLGEQYWEQASELSAGFGVVLQKTKRLGLQTGLRYTSRQAGHTDDVTYDYEVLRIEYVSVPVLARWVVGSAREGYYSPEGYYLSAGAIVSAKIAARLESQDVSADYSPFEASVVLEAGGLWREGGLIVSCGGRFSCGLADVSRTVGGKALTLGMVFNLGF